jgi:hypothetical protein
MPIFYLKIEFSQCMGERHVHQSVLDMDFDAGTQSLMQVVGKKTETRFLLGLEVPDSDQSMETVIFG